MTISAYRYYQKHVEDIDFISWKRFLASKLEYGSEYFDTCNDHLTKEKVSTSGDYVLNIPEKILVELEVTRIKELLAIQEKHKETKTKNKVVAEELKKLVESEKVKLGRAKGDYLSGLPEETKAQQIYKNVKTTRQKHLAHEQHELFVMATESVISDLNHHIRRLEQ